MNAATDIRSFVAQGHEPSPVDVVARRSRDVIKWSGFLHKSMVALWIYTPVPAPCIRYHTARVGSKIYNELRGLVHPNQSSVGGSLILATRCRGERRKSEGHTLPWCMSGLLIRLIPIEFIEAMVDAKLVRITARKSSVEAIEGTEYRKPPNG